jgi:hypothetical protein
MRNHTTPIRNGRSKTILCGVCGSGSMRATAMTSSGAGALVTYRCGTCGHERLRVAKSEADE